MKDLCQVCRNFKNCGFGEGEKLRPNIKQVKVKGFPGCWEVVECNLFEEYPKKD